MRQIRRQRVTTDAAVYAMPVTAEILGADYDPAEVGAVDFWYIHDDTEPQAFRTFVLFGTGQIVDGPFTHRATFGRDPQSGLVFHLFEAH